MLAAVELCLSLGNLATPHSHVVLCVLYCVCCVCRLIRYNGRRLPISVYHVIVKALQQWYDVGRYSSLTVARA
jgi:hypothetical protein